MSILAMLRQKREVELATAIPAIPATHAPELTGKIASVATVTVAKPRQEQTAATNWLLHFGDRDPLEVAFSPAATHTEVLACYPDGLAAEPIAPPQPIETSCRDCQHFAMPGLSDGYCAGRDDLPLAYGANHPLRKLPDDGGASCHNWQARTYGKGN